VEAAGSNPATPTSIIKALFIKNERGFFILQRCGLCLQERKNEKVQQSVTLGDKTFKHRFERSEKEKWSISETSVSVSEALILALKDSAEAFALLLFKEVYCGSNY